VPEAPRARPQIINSTCPACGGHKVVLKTITRSVHVPPGAPDTWSTILFQEGDQVLPSESLRSGRPGSAAHRGSRPRAGARAQARLRPRWTAGQRAPALHAKGAGARAACGPLGSVGVGRGTAAPRGSLTLAGGRQTHDLVYRANITLFEALLGFSLNITSVDNRSVEVKHDAVSQPGFSKTISNEGMPVLGAGSYGDLIVMFDIDFPRRLDDAEKELLGSVLDEEEIAKIEQMIFRRSVQENLAVLARPIGHTLLSRPGIESFSMVHMIDLALAIPYHGLLQEWALFATAPGSITLQVWRPAPRTGEFADHSYSLMGQTTIELDQAGPARVQVLKHEQILCEEGDVLGWRVDADSLLPFDSSDHGNVRITKSPILRAELGRTETFPFSIARTYSLSAVVKSAALLYDDKVCLRHPDRTLYACAPWPEPLRRATPGVRGRASRGRGRVCGLLLPGRPPRPCPERAPAPTADCALGRVSQRFVTGDFVNDRVQSVLVPPGVRVRLFQQCGGGDEPDGPDIDNRANPKSACHNLPLKLSHIHVIRS